MTFSIPPRRFSTALPLQIPSNPRPVRSNPLIGNIAAPEAAQPRPSEPRAPVPPPPPPPPPFLPSSATTAAAAEEASAESKTEEKSPFAYNALEASPFIDIANIISDKGAAYARAHLPLSPTERPNVRTKAVAGRTVFIKDYRLGPQSAPTPLAALRVLDRMCRDQKIRNKYHSQKFHERKGLKKKRLRSQRWRARFKTGFKAAVTRVLELKKQGW
ncbi:Ribosomal protein S21 [Moelleriella libera RCEF 2490]|uniref:Ribosomal protein S21 n=1 Tax=Moelleriella libera RCEF 2490 TaxID=1081109 RepID=A0A167ZLN0_9HYPO|nr:Ribosomal protein S21 [Moelleriella libera RCEF 2490]